MKEDSISMEKGGAGVAVVSGIAEVVVKTAVDFVEEVIPDELKPKEKPVQKPSESLGDLMKMIALRAEIKALMSERNPQAIQSTPESASPPSVVPTVTT